MKIYSLRKSKKDDTTFTSLRTKMRESTNYSLLLGLPCGVSEHDVEQQKSQLRINFMNYFTTKAAAGVVEIKRFVPTTLLPHPNQNLVMAYSTWYICFPRARLCKMNWQSFLISKDKLLICPN